MAHISPIILPCKLRDQPYVTLFHLLSHAEYFHEAKDPRIEHDILDILKGKITEYCSELKKQNQ